MQEHSVSGKTDAWRDGQVHGFPKVMGVLTHLDGFKDVTRLKNTKKALKHRFWAEIYQGGTQIAAHHVIFLGHNYACRTASTSWHFCCNLAAKLVTTLIVGPVIAP